MIVFLVKYCRIFKRTPPLLSLIGMSMAMAGCNWVDGTGTQTSNTIPTTEVFFDDGTPLTVVAIEEKTGVLITSTASDRDGTITAWRWSASPVRQGRLPVCEDLIGFDALYAVETLGEACGESCQLSFEQREVTSNDGETPTVTGSLDASSTSTVQFIVQMPTLQAPVGVTYTLTATDNRGASAVTEHTFCVNSLNDPPLAVDDIYTVLETEVLQPELAERNLLNNDIDDKDVRAPTLTVNTQPETTPFAASDFELFSDGTFRYKFGGSPLVEDFEDRFEYEISDGIFESTAVATVRVLVVDDPPVMVAPFQTIAGVVGIELNENLADNIDDPEQAMLSFSTDIATLPPSGEVTVSELGLLTGAPGPEDIDLYSIELIASDGNSTLEFSVPLDIAANMPIRSQAIPDQEGVLGERISFSVNSFFTDPESQPIQFSIESEDDAVDLTINSRTGLVTGFVREAGEFELIVTASDGVSEPVAMSFVLEVIINNRAPEFLTPIESQTIRFGRAIENIVPEFSDPDGDRLTYSIDGNPPAGQVVATDPDGLSAESNRFSIFVR